MSDPSLDLRHLNRTTLLRQSLLGRAAEGASTGVVGRPASAGKTAVRWAE